MTVWIDIANAPHVTFFAPVVRRMHMEGIDVAITTWDRGVTATLARAEWPDAVIAGPTPAGGLLGKAWSIGRRVERLYHLMSVNRPSVAIGHNSYAQGLAARALGVPYITLMDYEHQPANHLAFRLADAVLVPEAIPKARLGQYGAGGRVHHYRGIKEEIALADFRPDPAFRSKLGLSEEEVVAVVRPAAEGALYHLHRNTLCDAVIGRLADECTTIISPRSDDQVTSYSGLRNVRVLDRPVSGPDLLFAADLVVGAGGTMTREAVVLGANTYSMFQGRRGAVDESLVEKGRLRWLDDASQLVVPTERVPRDPPCVPQERLQELMRQLIDLIEDLPNRRRSRPRESRSRRAPRAN